VIFKPFVDLVAKAFSLSRDLQENKDSIHELRAQLVETNEALQELALEIRVLKERENQLREHQRAEAEKLKLELENFLLRSASKQIPARKKKS
jgi:SMC interacting uncharacterized protein involved in chromosome segregation